MFWLINLAFVLLFVGVFLYLPGKIITYICKIPASVDFNIGIGLVVFLPFLFFARWIMPVGTFLILFLSVCIFVAFKLKIRWLYKPVTINLKLIVCILVGVIAQSWVYIASLLAGYNQIKYALLTSHDQSWHMSLINELGTNFPPTVPGFAGEVLHNYHYLYDLLIAANAWVFKADVYVLLQVIYPILISCLFGLAVYRVSALIIKNKYLQIASVFMAYFANNLSYIWYWLGFKNWQSDALLLDQPIIYLYNHQTVLSLAIVLYGYILVDHWFKKQFDPKISILLALILTTLMGLKVYAFGIFSFSLALTIAIRLVTLVCTKSKMLFKIIGRLTFLGILLILFIGIMYLLVFRGGNSFLSWNPGWIVDQFFVRNILPISKELASKRAIYQILEQHAKLIIFDIFIAIIFILGNLNVRLLGLFGTKNTLIETLLIISSVISMGLVLFFNQSNSAFNIIQFAPYATIGLGLLMISFVDKLKYKYTKIIVICICVLISLPVSVKTVLAYKINRNTHIDNEIIKGLEILKQYPQGFVAILDQSLAIDRLNKSAEIYRDNNIVGAISSKQVYYFDKTQLEVLRLDFRERETFIDKLSENICNLSENEKQEIIKRGIKYLIVPNTKKCAPYHSIYDSQDFAILKTSS